MELPSPLPENPALLRLEPTEVGQAMDEYPPPRFSDWGPSTPWALQEGLSLPVPWPPPSDTWLIAPRTSPNLSKPQRWIEIRLQQGPATSRRHLTCQEDWEMSPTPALGHSGSPWWPLCSRDCPPPASCCHDFHCPVCACVCVCVCAGPSSLSGSDPSCKSHLHAQSSPGGPTPPPAPSPALTSCPSCTQGQAGPGPTQGWLDPVPPPSFPGGYCGFGTGLPSTHHSPPQLTAQYHSPLYLAGCGLPEMWP